MLDIYQSSLGERSTKNYLEGYHFLDFFEAFGMLRIPPYIFFSVSVFHY